MIGKLPADGGVTAYARRVVAGQTVAGRLVRLACARHLRDLAEPRRRGLEWRPAEARRAVMFFAEVLCLPEETAAGELLEDEMPAPETGSPFILQPWQQFIVGSLMGWYTAAGYRRFHDAYIEGAKGCGKTPAGAGLMLYLLVADGERGAQVYFAATTRDQAKLAFADAEKMVNASPALRDLITQTTNNLAVEETGSFLRAISSEKRGLDGKRVHGALIDEEHEHPTPIVVGKVRRGTKGRRNALVVRTTNSGFDRTSICWHDHEYSRLVLEGGVVDESWFAFVCGLDPCAECQADGKEFPEEGCPRCDDWRVEGPHWLKACPNLGTSVSWQYVRDLVQQAKRRPDLVSDLLRFNFCVWTQSQSRAIRLTLWQACQAPPPDAELVGVPCFGGLDLGQSDDLSAWARGWWFAEAQRLVVKVRFWAPRAALERFPNRPYDEWQRAQVLTLTDGNTTDYRTIEKTIEQDCQASAVREVAYDKRFAEQLAQNLGGRGVTMVETQQGYQLNEAIKRVLELIANGTFCHGQNPILSWMAGNVVVRHGTAGEIRLDKEHAPEKIDGFAAICMLFDRIVRGGPAPEKEYQLMVFGPKGRGPAPAAPGR